jgi:hypothetical protein
MLLLLVALLVPVAAFAQVTDEPAYVRTMAMGGAQRAVGSSNETLQWNPAGMAMRKRYEIDAQYLHVKRDAVNAFDVSIVDSTTGPVAGGVHYTYATSGPRDAGIHRLQVGFGLQVSESLALGISGRHVFGHYTLSGAGETEPKLWAGDVGLLARVSDHLQLGASARNVIRDERSELTRRDIGAGIAYVGEAFLVTAEADWDLEDKKRASAYRVGAEYVAGGSFPLRLGYAHQPYTGNDGQDGDESMLGGGAGILVASGSINAGYQQSLSRDGIWKMSFALTLGF